MTQNLISLDFGVDDIAAQKAIPRGIRRAGRNNKLFESVCKLLNQGTQHLENLFRFGLSPFRYLVSWYIDLNNRLSRFQDESN